MAAQEHNLFCLELLIKHGITVNSTDTDGKHAFHYAASCGHLSFLEKLLPACPDHLDALKKSDWTPLMMACTKFGNLKVVRFLVDNGARLDLVNKDGWNAVFLAGRTGDIVMFKFLVEKHQKGLEQVSKNGRYTINTILQHGHSALLSYLLENHEKETVDSIQRASAILDAAICPNPEIFKVLSKHFSSEHDDWSKTNKAGFTPLHLAAQKGILRNVECLLELGVDINLKSQCPAAISPLHAAYQENQKEMISFLVSKGAVEAADNFGRLPVDCFKRPKSLH